MMKRGGSYFLKMAEMDLKTATSTMEALVRISVSSLLGVHVPVFFLSFFVVITFT